MNLKSIDKSELLKWIAFGVIAIVLVVFMMKFMQFITKMFTGNSAEEKKATKELATKTQDAKQTADGGTVRPDFNASIYANDLLKVNTENYTRSINLDVRCKVYERVVTELSNNELRKVYNYYKNELDRMLTQDLKDVVWTGCSYAFWKDSWHTKLTKRLNKLNVV